MLVGVEADADFHHLAAIGEERPGMMCHLLYEVGLIYIQITLSYNL